MAGVPNGTVTFLFTDIEGSTKLARQYPESWEAARAKHHAILQEAIEAHRGFVFQIIGDAFCVAFFTAGDALKAAIKSQKNLLREAWGDVVIRVRMGIHTGEAETDGKDYRGYLTMSLVQRLMSAGHGGQVLVSGATENLLRGQLPKDVSLRDLGRHTFRDVPKPVRVFQLTAPDLQAEFPPLRTVPSHPNNLPTQLTSFVGREKELGDIQKLLSDTHILTLIGPGGTGKTRLSIQVASALLDRFPDGLWLVELAPILDPLLVPRTTAMTMGLRDEPQRPVIDMLCDYLREKKMLLVLDNCEHLVDACARMADRILHAAPDVRILASSREALGIGGEVTYRVPSLGLPDVNHLPPVESLTQYEAVKLFIDRATAAVSTFTVTNENAPALAQVCSRLDGIPLGIELAAAKVRVLSVDQIAKRLDDRFKLLTGGSRTSLERHQTLRAAIDWSYNLLPLVEQVLFRRLSVFVGGWTLEAAESVCSGGTVKSDDVLNLLEQLINKSLVMMDETQVGTRYHMLETIRQYTSEKLMEAGESDELRDTHLEYFLILTETAEPHLIRPEQIEWLPLLDADYENLRVAFDWSLSKASAEVSLRLGQALEWFWEIRGYWLEGLDWLTKAVEKHSENESRDGKVARVRALYKRAQLEWVLGNNVEAMLSAAKLSLELALEVADKLDVAIARNFVGVGLGLQGDNDKQALGLIEQSYEDFKELNETFWQARSFPILAWLSVKQGKLDERERYIRLVELARKAGERLTLAVALSLYADQLYRMGRLNEAKAHLAESEGLYEQLGAESSSDNALLAAEIAWENSDYDQARFLYSELMERFRLLGEKYTRSWCSAKLGMVATQAGDLSVAKTHLEEALMLAREGGFRSDIAFRLTELSNVFYLQGNLKAFKQSVKESFSLRGYLSDYGKTYILMTILASLYLEDPARGTQILGVTLNHERKHDLPLKPFERQYCILTEVHARKVLGDGEFESRFAEGQKMSFDDAMELVLKTVEEM